MNRNISLAAAAVVIIVAGTGIWYATAPKATAPAALATAAASPPAAPAAGTAMAAAPPAALAQAPAPGVDAAALAPRAEGPDMVMGAANAPVTIIEYASLTCPHCAAFNTGTFPQLKAQYIDKGLVKFVYRDFPLDGAALQASKVARCAGPERFFAFVDVFFAQQPTWLRGATTVQQAVQNLKPLARLGGMSDAAFEACLKNTEIENAVLEQRQKGEKEWEVDATPTLIVNGRKYKGSHEFPDFDQFLRPLAGKV